MNKHTFKTSFLLLFVIASLIFFCGCLDSGSSGDDKKTNIENNDPANTENESENQNLPVQQDKIKVKVIGSSSAKALKGATVVIGNPDGSMVDFGTTDDNGEIEFDYPPVNAVVTAVYSTSSTTKDYCIATSYDINFPSITLLPFDPVYEEPLGKGTLTIVNNIGADYFNLSGVDVDYDLFDPYSLIKDFEVDKDDIQIDDKFSIIGFGIDFNNNLIGYGTLLDQEISENMNISIVADKTNFDTKNYNLINTPDSTKKIEFSIYTNRKPKDAYNLILLGGYIVKDPIPKTVQAKIIPGIGTESFYSFEAFFDDDRNNKLILNGNENIENIDFNNFPPIPTGLSADFIDTDKPKLSWNAVNDDSMYIDIDLDCEINNNQVHYSINSSSSRNSIILPELPDNLSELKDMDIYSFSVQFIKGNYFNSYEEWIKLRNDRENYLERILNYTSFSSSSEYEIKNKYK